VTGRPPSIRVRTSSNEASPTDGGDAEDRVALLRSGFRSDTPPPGGVLERNIGGSSSTPVHIGSYDGVVANEKPPLREGNALNVAIRRCGFTV
jgi:hypothetical protein